MTNVIFKNFITRKEIKENKDKIYVFGDNLQEIGFGGQAKEMRGEDNTIGIPTKKSSYEFFSDKDYDQVTPIIQCRFAIIRDYLQVGRTIVIPKAGIGTGFADLFNKAPKIWQIIKMNLEKLGWKND